MSDRVTVRRLQHIFRRPMGHVWSSTEKFPTIRRGTLDPPGSVSFKTRGPEANLKESSPSHLGSPVSAKQLLEESATREAVLVAREKHP